MLIVVTYDVVSDRRRLRLGKWLEGFGDRVQKSVFECDLDSTARARMEAGIRARVEVRRDNVIVYAICAGCAARVTGIPVRRPSMAVVV